MKWRVSKSSLSLRVLSRSSGWDFGGGSDAAVRLFQAAKQLTTDGEVGQQTWASLFPDVPIPAPAILDESVQFRCMALTAHLKLISFFRIALPVFPVILMDRELVSGSYSGTLVRAACSLFCKRSTRRIRTSWSRYLARTMRSSRLCSQRQNQSNWSGLVQFKT